MKRYGFALLVLAALLLPVSVFATPFLVCDPYLTTEIQPTYFELVIDSGAPVQSPAQVLPDSTVRLHHDLAALPTGNHTVGVKACNGQGCSASVPFAFAKGTPASPKGIGLSTN